MKKLELNNVKEFLRGIEFTLEDFQESYNANVFEGPHIFETLRDCIDDFDNSDYAGHTKYNENELVSDVCSHLNELYEEYVDNAINENWNDFVEKITEEDLKDIDMDNLFDFDEEELIDTFNLKSIIFEDCSLNIEDFNIDLLGDYVISSYVQDLDLEYYLNPDFENEEDED